MIDITTGSWKWDENGIQDRMKALLEDDEGRFKVTDIRRLPEGVKITATRIEASVMDHFYVPLIKKVIFNYPATIIIWNDNSKTVVKLMEGDTWDPEKGFAMAYLKKILGTQRLRKEIKTWVKPQEEYEFNFEALNSSELMNAVTDYIKKAFGIEKPNSIEIDQPSEDK